MTAYRTGRYAVIGCKLKQNENANCNSCASLAGLVFSFSACFILLVIAPLDPPLQIVTDETKISYPERPIIPAEEWRVRTAAGTWPSGTPVDTPLHPPTFAMRHRK